MNIEPRPKIPSTTAPAKNILPILACATGGGAGCGLSFGTQGELLSPVTERTLSGPHQQLPDARSTDSPGLHSPQAQDPLCIRANE
jgi:hypothetical protein